MHCKIAESEDIRECFAQVHCVWPHAEDPDEHLLRRLDSIQHKRATWIVGKTGDAVVCSLGAYPIELKGPDGTRPARAFGAVFTPEMQRGQGKAAQLLNWAMDYYAAVGVLDFVLFSDIDPGYYQRLGFVVLPSYGWSWELDPKPRATLTRLTGSALEPQDPGMVGCSYGLARSTDEAQWVQDKQAPTLSLTRVLDEHQVLTGEWLLAQHKHGSYYLLESNLSQTSEHWLRFRDLVTEHAASLDCHKAKGWWTARAAQPDPLLQADISARAKEILMWNSRRGPLDPWREQLPGTGFRIFLSEHV